MDIKYELKGNRIIFENAIINVDFPIGQVLEVVQMLIIRLEKPFGTLHNENVFGIDLNEKKIAWKIASLTYGETDCPYVHMGIAEGKVRLQNWCDFF